MKTLDKSFSRAVDKAKSEKDSTRGKFQLKELPFDRSQSLKPTTSSLNTLESL